MTKTITAKDVEGRLSSDELMQLLHTALAPRLASVDPRDLVFVKPSPTIPGKFIVKVGGQRITDVHASNLEKEARLEVDAGVELPRVYITWPTPAMFAPGDGELDLAAHVLSGGKTSRLYKRLVYDMQIAQDVSAYQSSAQLGSTFEIVATAQPGHTAGELLKAIDEELATLRSGGVKDAELARARTSTSSAMVFSLEKNSSRANTINTYNQIAGDPNYLAKDLARYEEATETQVWDAVRSWLPEGKRVVTIVTPVKGAPVCGVLRGGGK